MKKHLAALAVAVLILVPLNAVAAVKAGTTCAKLGATSTYAGKKYTCIKSGTKLVWNSGVAIAVPKPSATPTPSPSPTQTLSPTATPSPKPTVTPTPTPAPIIEKTPTSFSDLVENFKGIYISAWNSADAKIKSNSPQNLKVNIFVGPNTKLPNSNASNFFLRGTQLFAGYTQAKSLDAIYYTFDDVSWASQKLSDLYGNPEVALAPSRNCTSRARCDGASANVPIKDYGQANFGVLDGGHMDNYHLKGGIEMHEYAHTVQRSQFIGKTTANPNFPLGFLPNWFIEGHAHFAGNAGSAQSLSEYRIFRSIYLDARVEGLPGYNPESIESFYEKLGPGKMDASVKANTYTIGYFTVEALVAIKGADSPIELIKLSSDGLTWEEAFLKVYGIEWRDAAPILAKTVSRMFLER